MSDPLEAYALDELRRRTSQKWRWYPPDVLPLWVAEMDVEIAPPVVDAVARAMATGDTGYAYGTAYAEAFRDFANERWGWQVDIGATALVPDVMLGVVESLKLVTGDADAVVVNPPVYPPFYTFIEHMGRRVVEAPLGDDHRLDPANLERAFIDASSHSRSSAFLLCSPHNPTGTVHSSEELAAVADLAARFHVRVIADEVHAPLVYDDARFIPYETVPGSENAFSVVSASKGWNLPGLKAALVIAGRDAVDDLKAMPEEVSEDEPSHLGVIAHSAALREAVPWLDALLEGLDRKRHLLRDLLSECLPSIRHEMAGGTYFAWLDCSELGLGSDPAELFLERGRVALNSGPSFGVGGEGHVRLNYATSSEILHEAVRRMAAALAAR